jgi:hypothetical protein
LTLRHWQHVERARRAFEATDRRGAVVSVQVVGELPEVIEHEVRFNATADGWFREERDEHVSVRGPEGTVVWSPHFGAVAHEDGTVQTSVQELLDPAAVPAAYDLELLADTTVAGRRARRIRATPRGERFHLHSLPRGADEIELAVDAERGVLLRSESRFEGEPFALDEVTSVEFPPGERVRTAEEAFPWSYVSLEEAASRASFTVFVPADLDARWNMNAIHHEAGERARAAETVHVLFYDDALHNFTIEEAGEPLLAWRTDEPELVDGLSVYEGTRPGPPTEVRLERDGTHVRVSSDTLDRGRLVEIAQRLVPAPTELPPV